SRAAVNAHEKFVHVPPRYRRYVINTFLFARDNYRSQFYGRSQQELRHRECLTRDHLVLLFFFSSRRRHTRSKRDWSSDVCSSDLAACDLRFKVSDFELELPHLRGELRKAVVQVLAPELEDVDLVLPRGRSFGVAPSRSEERRVGKECRSRW